MIQEHHGKFLLYFIFKMISCCQKIAHGLDPSSSQTQQSLTLYCLSRPQLNTKQLMRRASVWVACRQLNESSSLVSKIRTSPELSLLTGDQDGTVPF